MAQDDFVESGYALAKHHTIANAIAIIQALVRLACVLQLIRTRFDRRCFARKCAQCRGARRRGRLSPVSMRIEIGHSALAGAAFVKSSTVPQTSSAAPCCRHVLKNATHNLQKLRATTSPQESFTVLFAPSCEAKKKRTSCRKCGIRGNKIQGGHGAEKWPTGWPFAFCAQRSAFEAVKLCMLTVTLILNRLLRKKSARRAAGATVRVLKVSGFSRQQQQRRA